MRKKGGVLRNNHKGQEDWEKRMQELVKVAEDVRQGDVDEKADCESNCGEKRGVSTCTQHANWCDLCETFSTLFSTLISKDTRVQTKA